MAALVLKEFVSIGNRLSFTQKDVYPDLEDIPNQERLPLFIVYDHSLNDSYASLGIKPCAPLNFFVEFVQPNMKYFSVAKQNGILFLIFRPIKIFIMVLFL
jgi:hypothetical protein